MAKTAFKGTPVTLAGEFVKAGTSAPEFTLVKGDLSNFIEYRHRIQPRVRILLYSYRRFNSRFPDL